MILPPLHVGHVEAAVSSNVNILFGVGGGSVPTGWDGILPGIHTCTTLLTDQSITLEIHGASSFA